MSTKCAPNISPNQNLLCKHPNVPPIPINLWTLGPKCNRSQTYLIAWLSYQIQIVIHPSVFSTLKAFLLGTQACSLPAVALTRYLYRVAQALVQKHGVKGKFEESSIIHGNIYCEWYVSAPNSLTTNLPNFTQGPPKSHPNLTQRFWPKCLLWTPLMNEYTLVWLQIEQLM